MNRTNRPGSALPQASTGGNKDSLHVLPEREEAMAAFWHVQSVHHRPRSIWFPVHNPEHDRSRDRNRLDLRFQVCPNQDQEKAKEQFKTTLEAFQAVTGFDGGDLEKIYKKLNGEFEDTESRAKKVHDRVDSVEKVAQDMFAEWEGEIASIRDAGLKGKSRALLLDTKQRYAALVKKMRAAEKRMEPVLAAFRDQVLFLKHNLNARAIRSLKETSIQIDSEVSQLVKDLEASIQEADSFIATMET